MNVNSTHSASKTILNRIGELYIRGLLVLVGIGLAWYLIDFLWRKFDSMAVAPEIAAAVLVLFLLLPLPLGWVQHKLWRKVFERTRPTRALGRMEDRLVAELALDERRGYPVVLVNVPNESIRSQGLVTATIAGKDQGSEFAAVFLPRGPGHGLQGNVRIISVAQLEYTDWSLQAFLQHHLSYGSSSPGTWTKRLFYLIHNNRGSALIVACPGSIRPARHPFINTSSPSQ